MIIIEKDINLFLKYRDRMIANVEVIKFARKNKLDLNNLFYMTRRKRLINEEIYL